jgi:trigger factor
MHTIKLGPYKNLNVASPPMFTDEELNIGVMEAAKRLATQWAKAYKPAELGDTVIIDLSPECDNMFVPELAKSNYELTLGNPSVLEHFNQIIGYKAGDVLVLEIPFPLGFFVERVAGKTVTFHVTLREVKHRHPPQLTDEIARQIDPEVSGLDELKNKLRQIISENWLQTFSESRTRSILDTIAQHSEYELDQEEFQKVINQILASTQKDLFSSSNPQIMEVLLSGENSFLYQKSKSLALKTIKENLILTEIARLEKITVDQTELEEAKRKFLELTGDEQSFNRLYPSEKSFQQYVLREKVLDCLWEWNPFEVADKSGQ